jgi:hypothetical protein
MTVRIRVTTVRLQVMAVRLQVTTVRGEVLSRSAEVPSRRRRRRRGRLGLATSTIWLRSGRLRASAGAPLRTIGDVRVATGHVGVQILPRASPRSTSRLSGVDDEVSSFALEDRACRFETKSSRREVPSGRDVNPSGRLVNRAGKGGTPGGRAGDRSRREGVLRGALGVSRGRAREMPDRLEARGGRVRATRVRLRNPGGRREVEAGRVRLFLGGPARKPHPPGPVNFTHSLLAILASWRSDCLFQRAARPPILGSSQFINVLPPVAAGSKGSRST